MSSEPTVSVSVSGSGRFRPCGRASRICYPGGTACSSSKTSSCKIHDRLYDAGNGTRCDKGSRTGGSTEERTRSRRRRAVRTEAVLRSEAGGEEAGMQSWRQEHISLERRSKASSSAQAVNRDQIFIKPASDLFPMVRCQSADACLCPQAQRATAL